MEIFPLEISACKSQCLFLILDNSLEILKVGLHDGNYKGDGNNDDYNNNDDNDSNDEYDTIITTMMTTTKNGMVHGLSLWLSAGRRLLGDEDVDSAEDDNAQVQTGGGV